MYSSNKSETFCPISSLAMPHEMPKDPYEGKVRRSIWLDELIENGQYRYSIYCWIILFSRGSKASVRWQCLSVHQGVGTLSRFESSISLRTAALYSTCGNSSVDTLVGHNLVMSPNGDKRNGTYSVRLESALVQPQSQGLPLLPSSITLTALTSPTSGCRSVGIVSSRTQATDFVCLFVCSLSSNDKGIFI
jgi:hypothetical protein